MILYCLQQTIITVYPTNLFSSVRFMTSRRLWQKEWQQKAEMLQHHSCWLTLTSQKRLMSNWDTDTIKHKDAPESVVLTASPEPDSHRRRRLHYLPLFALQNPLCVTYTYCFTAVQKSISSSDLISDGWL